jgi:hypothetical protein
MRTPVKPFVKEPYRRDSGVPHNLRLMSNDARKLRVDFQEDLEEINEEEVSENVGEFELKDDDATTEFETNHLDDEMVDKLMAIQGYVKSGTKPFVKPFNKNSSGAVKEVTKDTKDLPCFVQFREGACPDGTSCRYSHDKAILMKHGKEEIARINNSPYMKTSYGRNALLAPSEEY